MPAKSRFTRLDAFTKTVEDARIRTTSGGIVTIASLLIVFYLVLGEWSDYRRIVVHPELIVDKGRGTACLLYHYRNVADLVRGTYGDTHEHFISTDTLRTLNTGRDGCVG